MHWRIGTFVEFEHLSDEDRDRLLKACGGRRMISVMVVRSVFFGIVFGVVCGMLAGALFGRRLPTEMAAGLQGLATVLGAVVVYQLQIIRIHGQLRIFLGRMARKEPLPMCLRCGYSLEGLSPDRCPECGLSIAVGAQ